MTTDHELLIIIRAELAENTNKTVQILRAFPSEDIEGHRRYHESVIEWRELRNRLVRESLVKVAQAGSLVAFGWLAIAVWQAIKVTVKQ